MYNKRSIIHCLCFSFRKPKKTPESSFMSAWLAKGQKVKPDEPQDKKMRLC